MKKNLKAITIGVGIFGAYLIYRLALYMFMFSVFFYGIGSRKSLYDFTLIIIISSILAMVVLIWQRKKLFKFSFIMVGLGILIFLIYDFWNYVQLS